MLKKTGEKIRSLREIAKISIADLATSASIDPQEMELIEQGSATPPISVYVKISKALGVRLGTILDGEESDAPAVVCSSELDPNTDFKLSINQATKPHLTYHLLAKGKSDRHMEPSLLEVEYVAEGDAVFAPHEGEEFLYVLEGCLVVRYGNKSYTLTQGQSMYYDSVVPHHLSSASPETVAKVIAVAYMPTL